MVLWYRALGGLIGKGCCLFPQGSDLLLVEPDLIRMGDRVCVNNASSIVCHLNTRGAFSLGTITLGDGATVRAFSRVMADATVAREARLLEHTLVMAGECLQRAQTRQGWPAHATRLGSVRHRPPPPRKAVVRAEGSPVEDLSC